MTASFVKRTAAFCLPLFLSTVCFAATATTSTSLRPNILLIVADDMGYADAGFQGAKDIPTPNLDQLAASGIRFTAAYSAFAFCSPARAALLTGRYPQRFGYYRNPVYDPASHTEGLPTSEQLLPKYLLDAGYKTGWIGKWHLGAAPEFSPHQRGFQESFGFIGGYHKFRRWQPDATHEFTTPLVRVASKKIAFLGLDYFVHEAVAPPAHMTIAQGQEAAAFVHRHRSEPWFLYLAFGAPHAPHGPTDDRYAQLSGIADPLRRAYAAQVSLMDDAIGETLRALHDSGQGERTLVIFLSDNGGPSRDSGSDNGAFRRGKGSVYEGGVRVPLLMSWPTQLAIGSTDSRTVSSIDLFATTLAAAGITMPKDKKYDSINLLPYLGSEKPGVIHERLFWSDGERQAVREHNWKLVRNPNKAFELYDLDKDRGETMNVATRYPDMTTRLNVLLGTWCQEMPEFRQCAD